MFTTFRGGQSGAWKVTLLAAVKGQTLASVPALSVVRSAAIALPLLNVSCTEFNRRMVLVRKLNPAQVPRCTPSSQKV